MAGERHGRGMLCVNWPLIHYFSELTWDEFNMWLQAVSAKLVCPVDDSQAARWHAGYVSPTQHGEWKRQARYYSQFRFNLCIAADVWESWNKHIFQMRSLFVHIIGLEVHLLWHGSIIALLSTLHKFYHTAQSEFNFVLI